MRKSGYYLSAAAGLSFLLMSATSRAFLIPTVDFSAISEGVKSNLELVKQSKVVVEGTALIGDVNSTIGDIKSNISDLGVDEAKRLAEKVQKEKENLEKAKEKYDKYKEKLDDAKEQVEKAKALKEKAQNKIGEVQSKVSSTISDAQEKIGDVKGKIDEAKEKVNDVKSKVDEAKETVNDVKSKVDEAKSMVNDAQDMISEAQGVVNGAVSKVNSSREQFGLGGSSSSEAMPSYVSTDFSTPETSIADSGTSANPEISIIDSGTSANLMSAQSEIARLSAELELLRQRQGETGNSSPAQTEGNDSTEEAYENLNEAQEEIKRLQIELEKYKTTGENDTLSASGAVQQVITSPSSPSPLSSSSLQMQIQNTETTPEEADTSVSSAKQTLTPVKSNASSSSTGGFRKRPTVSKDILGSLEHTKSNIHMAAYSHSEVLSFAQLDMESIPTGINSATDEFIISDEMAQYCNININETDSEAIKNCLEDIIRYRNDPDMKIAEEGEILYKNLMKETATGLTTEAIMRKNEATNYKDQVLGELNNDLGSASDVRDDIAALSQTNNQIQVLLNDLIKIQASRIMQSGLESLQDIKPTDIESEDSEEESES